MQPVRVKRMRKHGEPTRSVSAASTSITAAASSRATSQVEEVGLNLPYPTSCKLVRYHITKGASVRLGQLVASCRNEASDEIVELRSPSDGTLTSLYVQEDGHFDGSTDPVYQLECCNHNVVIEGLCAVCGLRVDEGAAENPSDVPVPKRETATVNVEGGLKLEVTRDEALSVREATVTRLFQARKLSLVLDLDHTLLHCTDDPRALSVAQIANPGAHVHTFVLDAKTLIMKLRPGLPSFLSTMKQYFEMYVYTAGTRAYAQEVCSYLDSDQSVFGDRIVSRDDTVELGAEKDLTRLFPVDDTMVLVVDDRDVWNGVANLITCEPFVYFTGMHDVNNPGWKTLSGDEGSNTEEGADAAKDISTKKSPYVEEETDPGLARVESILKQVHGKFFFPREPVTLPQQLSGRGSDVKVILRDIKLTVLRKVVIAFDPEIVPKNADISPQTYLETLFSKAKSCGATLVDQVDHQTTHLLSCGETDLANYGKQRGIWVVTPAWLEKSEHFWQRLKEEHFSVFKTYGVKAKSTSPTLPDGLDSSRSAAQSSANRPSAFSAAATDGAINGESEEDIDKFAKQLELELM